MEKLNFNRTLVIDDSELDDDYGNPFEWEEITTEKQERLMKLVEEINKKYNFSSMIKKQKK